MREGKECKKAPWIYHCECGGYLVDHITVSEYVNYFAHGKILYFLRPKQLSQTQELPMCDNIWQVISLLVLLIVHPGG